LTHGIAAGIFVLTLNLDRSRTRRRKRRLTVRTHLLSSRRKHSIWSDKRIRGIFVQILVLVLVFGFFWYVIGNAVKNLALLGKTFGFDFLSQPASYDINQHLIDYNSRDSHFRAGVVGVLNTLLIAFCGIILATIVGFILGVLRLSPNWLVNRLAYCYIEFVRNVPVLVHILLVHGIIIHSLPKPKQALNYADAVFLSNRGFYVPKPIAEPLFWAVAAAFLIGIIATFLYRRHARRLQAETGKQSPVSLVSLGLVVGLPLLVFLITGMPLEWETPALKGFNFKGGMVLKPEFIALWLALSLYTAAFIAEIVRAGILSVSAGQSEASQALGLSRRRTMNLVVIPQALRVIMPPLTSQYLNLTKNSSLAIVIGYMDIVARFFH